MKINTYKKLIFGLVASGMTTVALADMGTNQAPMIEPVSPQHFVQTAAIGGMKEIRFSEAALQKSQNPDVRKFANRMIKDHTTANDKLELIANREGLKFPPMNTFAPNDPNWNNPMVENPTDVKGAYLLTTNLPDLAIYQELKNLKTESGAEFDQAYAKGMVEDHVTTINQYMAASRDLNDPALKKFATKTLPTLRKHLELAQKLENELAAEPTAQDQSSQNGAMHTVAADSK